VDLSKSLWRREPVKTASEPSAEESVRFVHELYYGTSPGEAGARGPLVTLAKTYTVRKDSYSVGVSLAVTNHSSQDIQVAVDQLGPVGIPVEDKRNDNRSLAYGYLADGRVQTLLKPRAELPKLELLRENDLGPSDGPRPMLWSGVTNKFFASILYLRPAEQGRLDAPSYAAQFYFGALEENPTSRTYMTGLNVPALKLGAKQTKDVAFDLFAGPKKRDLFEGDAQYGRLGYIGTIDFGGCFCTFSWLTFGMMWLLDFFSKIAFGNYGVAIILLVVLVRLALHPLTKKSQVSMMKMQKLGPQMQKLKEKYADDKETLNREMMRFYKEQGAGPILGCLPMFLQMPIWIALWTGLNSAIELRHAAFLPFWITDLAAPEVIFSWSTPLTLPFMGPLQGIHLLPILLTVAMYFQTKMTPQMSPAAASPQQASQQKMMRIMMPVMMLFIFYNAPSGLTLYIMASTFAGVAEQIVIRKHILAREAAAAAAETTVEMPGKAARGSRGKKSKGPFFVKRG
jgi:YidC/Oxa1 family membrane protein insertase